MAEDKDQVLLKKLEAENLRREEIIKQESLILERQKAERLFGGKSELAPLKEPDKHRTPQEYAKAFLKGEVKLNEPEQPLVEQ